MRLTAALLTLSCLAACSGVQNVTDPSLARDDDKWRQRRQVISQAVQPAQPV